MKLLIHSLVCVILMTCIPNRALAIDGTNDSTRATQFISDYRAVGLGAAAALTIAVSVIGAGYAVARIGASALGAAAEKPELLARSIILVALAEGLAVLGFVVAILILQRI